MSVVQQQMQQIEALRQVIQRTMGLVSEVGPSLNEVSANVTALVGNSNQRIDADMVSAITAAKSAIAGVGVAMTESMAALSALKQSI